MMRGFNRILVHVDAMAASHPALDRAVALAGQFGAALKIVDVVGEFPRHTRLFLPKDLQALLVKSREERLTALADDLAKGEGREIPTSVAVRCGRPAIEIVREVLSHRHDVVLKSHASPADQGRGPLVDALDMQLLRKCPCPVWLVGQRPAPLGRVLAAIDPNPEDEVEQALNRRIVETAVDLADAGHGELVILNVWNAFGESLLSPLARAEDVAAYVEAARDAAAKDLEECLAPLRQRLATATVRLEQGEPGSFIPSFVVDERISLVVMGTVARTGITGWLMGNTAERILGALPCSVLTLKPEGFVCPVSLD